jgi:hypothetical protein
MVEKLLPAIDIDRSKSIAASESTLGGAPIRLLTINAMAVGGSLLGLLQFRL